MKALVIDDSRATRTILRGMLESIGFDVVEADNGSTGLEVLKSEDGVDIALVDWNMPVMSGYEFVQEVRQDSHYDELRLMMVTTETEMEQVVRALEAGANEYVMKPFSPEIIVDKLKILGLG